MQGKRQIAIVGAGPVGAVLAVLLAKEGFEVQIFEKRSDPTLGTGPYGRSVNLSLSMRAIKTIEMIGAKDRILKNGIQLYGRTTHNFDACHYTPYGKEGQCNFSISRHLLNNLLIEIAKEEPGVTIHFNQNLASFDLNETSLTFKDQDGQQYTKHFEHVFAADGAFSYIRKQFITTQDFNYSQEYSDFGYLEFELPAAEDGGFHFHANSFHLWPRYRSVLLAMANTNGSFTCNLFLPLKGPDSFESLSKDEDFVAYMNKQFPDAAPLMTTMLDTIQHGPRGRLQDIKCYPWVFSKFCLVGDAAHAIFPFYGQGLNAGFEDVSTLIELYREQKAVQGDSDNAEIDWHSITQKYQVARKINTDAISDLSKQNFVELRDKMADAVFLLKKRIIGYLSDNYDDLFIGQYQMISFSHTPYHVANAFGLVEEELVKEVKQIPNYKEMIEKKERFPEIEAILKRYQVIYLPNIGTFEVSKPIDCTRPLFFEGNSKREGFTCFDCGLGKKESPFPYDNLSVEKLTFCPHLHTTHAETECHIKIKDGHNIAEKFRNFTDSFLTLALEVKADGSGEQTNEVSFQQVRDKYDQILSQIAQDNDPNNEQTNIPNGIFKAVLIKFIYDDVPNQESRNITNFPYLSTQSVIFFKELGYKVFALNTPSFDNESSRELENHHSWFHGSKSNLVVEFVDASQLEQGPYIADIGVYPIDSDAAPCTLKMKRILSAKFN